jgi:uncharacterized protein (DUF305 family)
MQKNIVIVLLSLVIGGSMVYLLLADTSGSKNYQSTQHRMDHHDQVMDHSMHMMVASEREFIEGMIPHHQEAVDTAREVIERGGTTPEMRELVEAIVIAQEREIADMKQWYEDWYGEPYDNTGEYMPMMRDLSNLSGTELDRVFLEDMITHHMGAIIMANSVSPHIEHEEIANLADAIKTTQVEEIRLMRTLLDDL